MRVRILTNIVGDSTDYRAGDVVNASTAAANDLVNAGQAILEGPAPSGVIATLYSGAGYIPLTPDPSGYIGPSGYIPDVPNGQMGFYCPDPYLITVVFPGRRETTFDLLSLRPPAWR